MRLVLPVPAGGSFELLARGLASRLSAPGGDTWLVENRPGAETMIGSEAVARSAPDGRTVLMAGATLTLVPLMRPVNFSPAVELQPVVQLSSASFLLVVPTESPIRSAADLMAAARAKPQGLNCGAPPGPMGLACAQLAMRSDGKVTGIPYPGIAPAIAALMGGHLDMLFVTSESVVKFVESGKMRALAASATGVVSGPVPLFADAWPGFLMDGFIGLFVPAGTPPDEVRKLNAAANRALADPAFAALLREAGQEPVGGTSEQFAARMQRTRLLYGDLLRKLGTSPR